VKKLYLLVLLSLFVTIKITAEQKAHNSITGHRIDIKCYTELLAGGFMIHRNYNVPIVNLKSYKLSLKSINDDKTLQKNSQRKVIYKVLECRQMHETFKLKTAAKLDKLEENMG
jgi:hypothetical protein